VGPRGGDLIRVTAGDGELQTFRSRGGAAYIPQRISEIFNKI